MQTSAIYQNIPGIPITASYVATNAEILPPLGRNLGGLSRRGGVQRDEEKPKSYSQGMRYTIVNGVVVVDSGRHTGARPGRPLLGNGYKGPLD